MGHDELLAAIRRKGEEQAAALRARTEEEIAALRAAAAERRDALQREHEHRLAAVTAERHRDLVAEARRQGALIRLRGEHDLALRLKGLARSCLGALRDDALLERLAGELPPASWATVRVAPVDASRAAGLFPGATIEADPAITGGLVAVTSDDGLTVVNTLESRLEKGWPDLLPRLFADLRGKEP